MDTYTVSFFGHRQFTDGQAIQEGFWACNFTEGKPPCLEQFPELDRP